jgi:creatinine amidohydrolase/Fe(II)-dependent formamide hydrolase-like protein
MRSATVIGFFVLAVSSAAAQGTPPARNMGGGQCANNPYNCADAPNPLPAPNTVWLEQMTWMDVRDAIKSGKTTVIIPTGGMEPNGPWLATGKHNYILTTNCEAIARKLGNALCAPIVKFVPEGRIDPPSGHMTSPGTISLREETYRAMLADIVHSLKQSGFTNIILIGDSGGNQNGQRYVADSLTGIWKGAPVVAHVQEYYDVYSQALEYAKTKGYGTVKSDGLHDDPVITVNMFINDPSSMRYDERVKAGKAIIDGVSLADRTKVTEWARDIVEFRVSRTIDAINRSIAHKGTLPRAAR